MMFFIKIALTLIQLSNAFDYSQNTFDSLDCVDGSSMDTCWSAALAAEKKCSGGCQDYSTTDDNCVLLCGCEWFTKMINCALSYCWNRVCTSPHIGLNRERVRKLIVRRRCIPASTKHWSCRQSRCVH